MSTLSLAGKFKPADKFADSFSQFTARVQDRVAIGVLYCCGARRDVAICWAVRPSQSQAYGDADRSFRNPFAKLLENVHDRQSEDRPHYRRKPRAWA